MSRESQLPELPLLAPWYRLLEEDGRILLEHGHRVVALEGAAVRELLPALLPLLDGSRTVAGIVAAAGAPAEAAVLNALRLLETQGLLVDGPASDCGADLRDTAHLLAAGAGIAPALVAERILDARVGIVGDAPAAEEAARALRRAGAIRVERRGWGDGSSGDDLVVVAPAPHEIGRLSGWNEGAVAAGLCWLQLLPYDGKLVAIGPIYIPGETACRACYRLRRAASLALGRAADAIDEVPVRAGGGPVLAVAAGAIAALHALRWLAVRDGSLPGVLFALEGDGGLTLTSHLVLRVPRCPVCSDVRTTAAPLPWFQAGLEECA